MCFVVQYLASFLTSCNHLAGEKRAGCFTCYVFVVLCGCSCSLSHPHGAVGGSAVCDCGITNFAHSGRWRIESWLFYLFCLRGDV